MTLRLNKFCCCCTTRTGALVIGTLGWIFTIIQLFSGIGTQQTANDQKKEEKDFVDYTINNIYFKVSYGLVSLLVCILLVLGVYKKDNRFILPWMALKGFEIILIIILTIYVFTIACIHGLGVLFGLFCICLLVTVLHMYFWLCIWNYYRDLDEDLSK